MKCASTIHFQINRKLDRINGKPNRIQAQYIMINAHNRVGQDCEKRNFVDTVSYLIVIPLLGYFLYI